MENIAVQFGKQVRALRKAKEFSQESFADACQLDRSYMGRIERGEVSVTLATIEKIADTLGMPIPDLFQFHKPKRRKQ